MRRRELLADAVGALPNQVDLSWETSACRRCRWRCGRTRWARRSGRWAVTNRPPAGTEW